MCIASNRPSELEIVKSELHLLPWRAVVVLCLGNACHFYSICSLFSYAGFLCVDLGWARSRDTAGYVAGLLGSALTLGRLPTAIGWGLAADRFGRKPALLASFAGILAGNLAFARCTRLHIALAVRFVFLGAANGWVSLSATLVSEVAGASRQNDVNGYVLATGSLCQLVGPAAAALLYGDARWPRYPAMAPSLLGAALALTALVLGAAWLPETRKGGARGDEDEARRATVTPLRAGLDDDDDDDDDWLTVSPVPSTNASSTTATTTTAATDALSRERTDLPQDDASEETSECEEDGVLVAAAAPAASSLRAAFAVGVAVRAALGAVLFALFDTLPLFAIASERSGGLAISRRQLAVALSVPAAMQAVFTAFFMASAMRRYGHRGSLARAAAVGGLACAAIPFVGVLAKDAPFAFKVCLLAPLVTLFYSMGCITFAAACAIVNNSMRENRGTANGVAAMGEAVGKTIGPTLGAIGFAVGVNARPGLVGAGAIFWVLAAVLAAVALTASALPVLVEDPPPPADKSPSSKQATRLVEMTSRGRGRGGPRNVRLSFAKATRQTKQSAYSIVDDDNDDDDDDDDEAPRAEIRPAPPPTRTAPSAR